MRALLVQQGLVEALKGISALLEAEKSILLEKAPNSIILSLGDELKMKKK